jgi:translation initiation factor 3 subunit H
MLENESGRFISRDWYVGDGIFLLDVSFDSLILECNCIQALLKIVKHCHDALPQMVTGSLLGLVGSGILEVTHAFAFPETRDRKSTEMRSNNNNATTEEDDAGIAGGLDGHEYQMEMMRMLREVNVDNNCVGWYQSMYLGIYSTAALLENQWSYQTDLSPNAVVILYDPMQTAHGNLVLHCYRLTDECLKYKTNAMNTYIDPSKIFEEIPVKLTNPGLVKALLADMVTDGTAATSSLLHSMNTPAINADTTFDRLDLSTNPYLEKHLASLCTWVDDLAQEQQKFQYFTRQLGNQRGGGRHHSSSKNKGGDDDGADNGEGWASSTAPRRMESLLISNQIRVYCNQMDKFAGGSLGKLFLAGGLHNETKPSTATSTSTTAGK